jgi:trans-aconitate 2-methyltransferase
VHDAAFYYDVLAPLAKRMNLWETTYLHVLPSVDAIAEWYKATGLRPFLDALPDQNTREQFVLDYTNAIRSHYVPRSDGQVLFPFRRLFLIAYK